MKRKSPKADGSPNPDFPAGVGETGKLMRARDTLSESENRFRNIADHAPVMMWVTDRNGACTYLNRRWYEFTGQTAEQAEGFGWLAATHPDDKERIEREFLEANASQHAFRIEYRLRRADGAFCWAIDAAAPRFGDDGAFLGFVGSVIDIDDRKAAEERLRLRSEEFQTLADNIPTLCWMAYADGHIFWYNQRWYDYTGTSPEGQTGWGWESVHDPEMLPSVVTKWRRSIDTGEPFEMIFPLRGGDGVFRTFLTRIMPIRNEANQIVRWFGTNVDISAQREVEEDLRESEARFRAAVQAVEGVVWTNNARGEMEGEQQGWSALTGQTYEEYQGFGWATAVHPDDARATVLAWNEAVAERKIFVHEHRVRRASDGAWGTFSIRAIPVFDNAGAVREWVGVHTDITDRKRDEDRLRILMGELEHRGRNQVGVISMLAKQSLVEGREIGEARQTFLGRLTAIAESLQLVNGGFVSSLGLGEIVRAELHSQLTRVRQNGPDILLNPKAAQTFALVIHELTTNALKYGALSTPAGRVDITWEVSGTGAAQKMLFLWIESNGPPAESPSRKGFGARVIRDLPTSDFAATVKVEYRPTGLHYSFVADRGLIEHQELGNGGSAA